MECRRLDADTLSVPRVEEAIRERFVPLRLELRRDREVARRYGLFWTPTIFFLDPNGEARARSEGFLPADELLPLLDFGEAQVLLRRGRFREARERFDRVAERFPASGFAPDALYWAAIARYMVTGSDDELEEGRAELRRRYPDSLAARKT